MDSIGKYIASTFAVAAGTQALAADGKRAIPAESSRALAISSSGEESSKEVLDEAVKLGRFVCVLDHDAECQRQPSPRNETPDNLVCFAVT